MRWLFVQFTIFFVTSKQQSHFCFPQRYSMVVSIEIKNSNIFWKLKDQTYQLTHIQTIIYNIQHVTTMCVAKLVAYITYASRSNYINNIHSHFDLNLYIFCLVLETYFLHNAYVSSNIVLCSILQISCCHANDLPNIVYFYQFSFQ